ncbi:uncharacterized protein [Panulirus ornatus]
MLGVWAVLTVLCLASQAHAQLGEGAEAGQDDTQAWVADDSEGASGGREEAPPEDREEEEEEEEEPMTVIIQTPRRWKPLLETYQGCIPADESFQDSLMFVNLTQVMVGHDELTSVEGACQHLCLNKVPFSMYLTISPALNGSVDACGCHLQDELNLNDMVADEGCDSRIDLYRVYCGPHNIDCFSRAGVTGALSFPLMALPLLLAVLSVLADVRGTSLTYFGFKQIKEA